MKIDKELLDKLTGQAKSSPRLRMNLDLRNSAEDGSQRMLNALEPGTVANYNHLPIILLTAKKLAEDETEGLQAGADDFLTKPFRLKDLKLRIDNIIENRKRMQTEFSQESAEDTRQKVAKPLTPDEIFLNRVLDFVHQHLADEDYDRDALAADMGASIPYIRNFATTSFWALVKIR